MSSLIAAITSTPQVWYGIVNVVLSEDGLCDFDVADPLGTDSNEVQYHSLLAKPHTQFTCGLRFEHDPPDV